MPDASPMMSGPPPLDIRSPSITIGESNKQGILEVMFKQDPRIPNFFANTFYDSHIELDDKDKPIMVPNANYYQCPNCKAIKSKQGAVHYTQYLNCTGIDDQHRHDLVYTQPMSWSPITTEAGLYYLLGQADMTLNSNIATGNLSGGEQDMKRKMSLEDRLRHESWFLSFTMATNLIGQYKRYIAPWVLEQHLLAQVFNPSFVANFVVNMSKNIISNSSKAKGMNAASKAMETRVSTETQSHHDVAYGYPDKMYGNQKKSVVDQIGETFKFS